MTHNLVYPAMLHCNARRGCRAFIDGFSIEEWKEVGRPKGSDLTISRITARRLHGWVTDVPGWRRGAPRLDFCPEHAEEGR